MSSLAGRNILFILGAGIAAYKVLDVMRRVRERGAHVRTILTSGAAEFVTPLSVGALSEAPVFTELFDLKNETEIGHIRLAREADLIVVAPATADLMARMAHGQADDLATTVLLAADKPVLCAPAMNVRMWHHTATQRNLAQLAEDGIHFVGPDEGAMACGEYGLGRMAPVEVIVEKIEAMLGPEARPLAGRHILVTAGPTHEPIDPVRFIANRSSGKQGYAIAEAAEALGACVTLVSGPTDLAAPPGVRRLNVETAEEMLAAVENALPADAAIFAAAVADWRVAENPSAKLKKSGGAPTLALTENPDILKTIAAREDRPALVVGFAAETGDAAAKGQEKRRSKGCDWIVANDVSPESGVFGSDENDVTLVTGESAEDWPRMRKAEVARRLMTRIAEALEGRPYLPTRAGHGA
ncbi:bifunctional phosphopantothenoylcysteine decarboxylase/phosphopantothenate--cysteine ligase CoaBC [Dichotomicrobium thermohalophilum]|uniref:Coenzyme A biosynthesis bifunctional protein CoaBC n=1 Tax=Dichotomicrobium thermohalophilum TaxID=933063 RepID=A0A397Q396_9HYPH|nr:bifunctional phosphopantothenoylcysteine decarboxylase/phosphopantothenate--cysteine ligase CoaBC [Dichotomicrobium thermohalophilum]RIA55836.1 phosphopantothenate-cysteine ligase /phosphopantothenoylcysteine decarboxylase [Dichotomicrobium thermohalophilum]